MITIHGRARNQGIAIAVAAVVDAVKGINGVSQKILHQGITALRQQLDMKDYPEVIIACDDLTTGLAVKIPGVRAIGIAAQSDIDLPGMEIELPCAVGLDKLLTSIKEGDILILDGNKGVVHIDPDPPTLIHYQQMEEHREERGKIFISSEHIPARTQSGETVNVLAYVTNEQEITRGLEEGADGLLVDLIQTGQDTESFYEKVYTEAAGKPVWFAAEYLPAELARAAAKYALPEQTTVLLPSEDHESLMEEAETVIENVGLEAFLNDLNPPHLRLGLFTGEDYDGSSLGDDSPLALDLRSSTCPETERIPLWTGSKLPQDAVFLIGNSTENITALVKSGARSIAVTPDTVSAAKYAIRTIG